MSIAHSDSALVWTLVASIAATGCLSPPPDEPVTFTFAGVVDQVPGLDPSLLPIPVAVGDSVTGVYRFDPRVRAATDQGPNHALYTYDTAAGQFELHAEVGGLVVSSIPFGADPMGGATIDVLDGNETEGDSYAVNVTRATVTGFYNQAIAMNLALSSAVNFDALQGTEVPTNPPAVSDFETNALTLFLGGPVAIGGHLTSLVRSTATSAEGKCGDGVVNPGEDCDDFNSRNGDGCDDDCRFSCNSAESTHSCEPARACRKAAACHDLTHTCAQAAPDANFTPCGPNLVCWEGACTNVTAPPSQFVTFDFSAQADTPGGEVGVPDVISGSYTVDTAQPMNGNPTSDTYDFDNTPGHFGLHVNVGPLLLLTTERDPRSPGSWITTQSDGYGVTADQMKVEGSFVQFTNFQMNFFGGSGPPASLATLPTDLSSFDSSFIMIQLGDSLVSAHVTSLKKAAP